MGIDRLTFEVRRERETSVVPSTVADSSTALVIGLGVLPFLVHDGTLIFIFATGHD